MLPLALQHIVEDQLAQQLRLFGIADIDALDFPADISLLVSQEEVDIATTVDERFLFQPSKAVFDPAAQGQTVGIDLVQAECDQIVHRALHLFDVPDQEQHLEQLDIEGLQAGILSGLIDGPLDHRVQKTLDGRIELVQRHEDTNLSCGHGLAR